MKALVYQGPGKKALVEQQIPIIKQTTDAIVKVIKTTICGTDLHILKGDFPTCQPGRILGHEGIGIVDKVGDSVTTLKKGDPVLISCITSDGKCEYCRKGMYSHCIDGGWLLGHKIDGTQAEYVRVPHADTSLYKLSPDIDDDAVVMLSDIFPTGFECGVLNGKIQPGNTVAIVGAGPIGLATLLTAQFYSPALIIMIDHDDHRLEVAKNLGATVVINNKKINAIKKVMAITNNKGVDTAIEAVGIPGTFELCADLVTAGGTIANIGVHGSKADLHLERLWSHNISITTRLVDTVTTPMLLKILAVHKLQTNLLISHHFNFTNIVEAYDTFMNAAVSKALKVIIEYE